MNKESKQLLRTQDKLFRLAPYSIPVASPLMYL